MVPFEVYKTYLSLKNHFTKDNYDYHKYLGKSRVSLQSFYKRRDRYWFEKLSRQKEDSEIIDFFVANFVSTDDPQGQWIGNMIKEGESNYNSWRKRIQSLSYIFKEETHQCFTGEQFDGLFQIEGTKHPKLLKEHLKGNVSLETMIILDKMLGYKKFFDKKLKDPIWEFVSMRMSKYNSFLNIDVFHYKKILKDVIGRET